jgi:hypothetical protein
MAGQVRSRRRGLVALSVVAGLLAVAWLGTWLRLDGDRRQLHRQLAAAGQAQATDRFARALDQLGSEQLEIRLGGIYGLERIAAQAAQHAASEAAYIPPDPPPPGWWSAQERAQIFEVLSAYVRTNSHRPPVGPADGSAALQVRQPDVAAAATVLARRSVLDGDQPLDLYGSVLPGARLGWARLAQADLRGADVRGASLQYAQLAGAHLEQAQLCGAQLQGADLRGAHLTGARVSAETDWPPGFDWRAAGARLVPAC